MKKRTSYIICAVIVALAIILDLVSKYIFADIFSSPREDIVVIPNLFKFTFLKNTGAAFGMFGSKTIYLTIVTIVFIIGFVIYDIFNHSNSWWYMLGISMTIGGAIGNLVDRLMLGYVRDFLSMSIFSFVFNIADAFITFGVMCLVVNMLIEIIRDIKSKKEKNGKLDNK